METNTEKKYPDSCFKIDKRVSCTSEKKEDGFTYYTEIIAYANFNIEEMANYVAGFITDEVKKIHFTDAELQNTYYHPNYSPLVFTIKFLQEDWKELKIECIDVETTKYGYIELSNVLREKFPQIAVCAKSTKTIPSTKDIIEHEIHKHEIHRRL
jgi:hypothetical protein